MAKNKLSIQDASLLELGNLSCWYNLAGIETSGNTEFHTFSEEINRAKEKNLLSASYVGNISRRFEALFPNVPPEYYIPACTCIRTLRLNDETIGMVVVGAHANLINNASTVNSANIKQSDIIRRAVSTEIGDKVTKEEYSIANMLLNLLVVQKLRMISIDPLHRGRGHGKRLLRNTIAYLARNHIQTIFGQFDARNSQQLTSFYKSLGFTILNSGESLDVSYASGIPNTLSIRPLPNEVMFKKDFIS